MAHNTPVLAIPLPDLNDPPNVPQSMSDALLQSEKFSVPRFVDAATRNAAITAPVKGQLAVITGGTLPVLQMYSGTAWVVVGPAGQMAAPLKIQVNSGAVTAEASIGGGFVAFTADPARYYRILVTTLIQSTVAGDTAFLRIRQTNIAGPQILGINVFCPVASFAVTVTGMTVVSGWSGAQVVQLTIARNTGTGSISQIASSAAPTMMTVEDIGPV